MPAVKGVRDALAAAHRTEWSFVMAAAARITRDLDEAEECAQDAFERALRTWPRDGVPRRPGAWLTTAATNRARDVVRRRAAYARRLPLLVVDVDDASVVADIADDRLRLIFTCCHPALAPESRVALTLRLVCGLATAEIARAFLVKEATMAARITRAKHKIAAARIPYRVPAGDALAERVASVCDVLYLVFTAGHAASGEETVRDDLVELALEQCRLLHGMLPADDRVTGLLALMLLTDARRAARLDAMVALSGEQDRRRWDAVRLREGRLVLNRALRGASPNRYAVQAAIAAVHADAASEAETDWREIVALYDVLLTLWPNPVVALNRAVAVGMRDGPAAGLDALRPFAEEPALRDYGYRRAAEGHFLWALGRHADAAAAFAEAATLAYSRPERELMRERERRARAEEVAPVRQDAPTSP